MIVTSNKPFSAWGEIFGDDAVATAMLDRLVHHAEILALKGDSYRLRGKDLEARPAPTRSKTPDRSPSASARRPADAHTAPRSHRTPPDAAHAAGSPARRYAPRRPPGRVEAPSPARWSTFQPASVVHFSPGLDITSRGSLAKLVGLVESIAAAGIGGALALIGSDSRGLHHVEGGAATEQSVSDYSDLYTWWATGGVMILTGIAVAIFQSNRQRH